VRLGSPVIAALCGRRRLDDEVMEFSMTRAFSPGSPFALSALSAALLIACGGVGDASDTDTLSNESATGYAANASVIGSDAASALDAAVLTTSDLAVSAGATTSAAGRKQALSVTTPALSCAGGGTAILSVTNATNPLLEGNGQLDVNDVYLASFSACRRVNGGAALNGALAMTVTDTTANGATVTLATTTLSVVLPRGSVSFSGNATVQRSVTANNGSTDVSTRVTLGTLAVTTQFNGRTGQFTLSDIDLARQATFIGDVLQSAVYSGSHALSAVLGNLSYSYTVATQGGATFGADGLPTQGGWRITLPRRWITITVAGGFATIAIDEGKDGSVERTFTVPVAQLGSGAG
jgi:hypothetical protein